MLVPMPTYTQLFDNTFHKLTNYLDDITEKDDRKSTQLDATSTGINFRNEFGEYVFSRQGAARELWVSSPVTGPWKFNVKNKPNEKGSYEFRSRSGPVINKEFFKMVYDEIQ